MSWSPVREDTFIHETLHGLFTPIFREFDLVWANSTNVGSKHHCKDQRHRGLQPDLQIAQAGCRLAVLEAKPPGLERKSHVKLHDLWKVAGIAKDELNYQLDHNVDLPYIVAIQVFGKYLVQKTYMVLHLCT